MDKEAFAGYPSAVLYHGEGPDKPPAKKRPVKHLLWGEWMKLNKNQ